MQRGNPFTVDTKQNRINQLKIQIATLERQLENSKRDLRKLIEKPLN